MSCSGIWRFEPLVEEAAEPCPNYGLREGHGTLQGEWAGYRECHLADDWLLVYRIEGNDIYFARTGTHTDLFQA